MGLVSFVQTVTNRRRINLLNDSNTEIRELPELLEEYFAFLQFLTQQKHNDTIRIVMHYVYIYLEVSIVLWTIVMV